MGKIIRSPEYRKMLSERMKKKWRDGVMTASVMTEERKKKIGDAQRGKKRKPCTEEFKAFISKLNKGKCLRKTPISDIEKAASRERGYSLVEHMHSPEISKKISESLKKSPIAQASLKRAVEASKHSPRSGKFTTNACAKWWHLMSPMGKTYKFRNLANFIRKNPALFDEDDIMFNRAHGGLSQVHPDRKHSRASWKGWTWKSSQHISP